MQTLQLNGLWEMKREGDNEWLSTSIPGTMYSTYLLNGKIEDPLVGENDKKLTCLSDFDYVFCREFHVDAGLMEEDYIELNCKGLDTLATIYMNGALVAKTNNMHRSYQFDIKKFIRVGKNELMISFASPTKYIEKQQERFPLWGISTTISGYEHIRKGHHMFGWDWGPQLPDLGIWRDIEICGYSYGRIEDIMILQQHQSETVDLDLHIDLGFFKELEGQLNIEVISQQGVCVGQRVIPCQKNNLISFRIDTPELWWPNGYGRQALYTIKVQLLQENRILDEKVKKIGLRTIRLKRDKDQWGESFYFEVNGVGIFGMGGNYIPEDILITRPKREDTERLIKHCVQANFDCLRVWGGGVYPNDDFLDLCDEYGLIIWQDFMFACGVYRMTEAFTENVKQEFIDNVRRMRHHACLGLWCGNNEMEWGMVEWSMPADERFRFEYMTLYERLIPSVLEVYDPTTCYWPASPSSGGGFNDPNSEHKGDVHYWSVFHGNEHYKKYREHYFRFLSEYGMQSFPSLKTIQNFAKPDEMSIFNPVMENHNKCIDPVNGNVKVLFNMVMELPEPKNFMQAVYASQVFHGEALKCAVEHLRRNRGRCMGSTYWQINDNYTAISWSSIDYYGRWKAPHYYAKRFYAPVLVSGYESKDEVQIHVTNDQLCAFTGKLKVQLCHIENGILKDEELEVQIEKLATKHITTLITKELTKSCEEQRKIFVAYQLLDEKGVQISDSTLTLCEYKFFRFERPNVQIRITQDNNMLQVHLKSDTYVKAVGLDNINRDVIFEDNYVDLLPNKERSIRILEIEKQDCLDLENLIKEFTIISVNDLLGPNI